MSKCFGCLLPTDPADRTVQPKDAIPNALHANDAAQTVVSGGSTPTCGFMVSVDDLLSHLARSGLDPQTVPIVVLGQSLQADNTPSVPLQNRIKLAVELNQRMDAPLVVTGGDTAGVGRAEAEVMRDLLEEQGVQRSAILRENEAYNTLENALNVVPMLKGLCCDAVVLVTSEFHLPRSALLFEGVFAHEKFGVRILCIGAPSGHAMLPARVPRPWNPGGPKHEDISCWRMAERCEHEELLLDRRMPEWFHKYAIAVPPRDRFDSAKARLRAMA